MDRRGQRVRPDKLGSGGMPEIVAVVERGVECLAQCAACGIKNESQCSPNNTIFGSQLTVNLIICHQLERQHMLFHWTVGCALPPSTPPHATLNQ